MKNYGKLNIYQKQNSGRYKWEGRKEKSRNRKITMKRRRMITNKD